jgi:exonuclease VII small subunit
MDDQNSYVRLKDRLEEIVVSVRQKDLSLEKSLELYEEALRLGGRCVELIDRTDFTAEELEAVGLASTEPLASDDAKAVDEAPVADEPALDAPAAPEPLDSPKSVAATSEPLANEEPASEPLTSDDEDAASAAAQASSE